MDSLARDVLTYYFTHAGVLPREKQFHLANRLYTWNGDKRATALLSECRSWFVPSPVTRKTLRENLAAAGEQAQSAMQETVAFAQRQPFFERFPTLVSIEAELFHTRHLHVLFDIDASAALLERHPASELQQLEHALLSHTEAWHMLSTWAVNFLYLYRRELLHDEHGISVQALCDVGRQFSTVTPEQLRLSIYFYTHCIIAESNFYVRELPKANLALYRQMLARLEALLATRLNEASLDTKLEFLVCCRLMRYESRLAAAIYEECTKSVSPAGTFLIDTHNIFAENPAKKTFETSEHRNVLFAMSVLARR